MGNTDTKDKILKHRCPQCGKTKAWKGNKFRPFCSERCKLIDLGAWADEKYKVKSYPDEGELEEASNDDK